MAHSAVAQETVLSLRRTIARIEGALPERLAAPISRETGCGEETILRRDGVAAGGILQTGARLLDDALGGGLPKAALTEIHGLQTRDAGAVAGFALALVSRILKETPGSSAPILWVGTTEVFREAGVPHARGLAASFGIEPGMLLFSQAPKLLDALWVAEEAARLTALGAVILEISGDPARLDLTATRRLHRRSHDAGRPVLLLRHAGASAPTAAPVRLVLSAAPAAPRETLAGPLAGSIGRPAFTVAIDKSRTALSGQFTMEWNPDERRFEERPAEIPGSMVSVSSDGTDHAPASGAVLAFRQDRAPAASGHQPSREQYPAGRRRRRTG